MTLRSGWRSGDVYDRVDVRDVPQPPPPVTAPQDPGQPARPDRFKLGFTAASGGATNNYEVSNFVATADVDLSVEKTGPQTAYVGDQVQWEIQASNDGTNPADDVVVTDTIPAGIADAAWTCEARSRRLQPPELRRR